MGSFGERLRREREMRKISLDEIAAATKIGTRHLRALEDEEFKKLPGGIFNKGFVRAYARFLGINEEQAVSDYLTAAGEPENQTTEIMVDQLVAQHEAEKKVKVRSRELETINRSETGVPWAAITGLVLVIVAAAGGWTYYSHYKARMEAERTQQAQQAQPAPQPVQSTPVTPVPETQSQAAPEQQPATMPAPNTSQTVATAPSASVPQPTQATTGNAAPEASSQVPDGGFVVSIRATKLAWVEVKADGKRVMSLNLTPSEAKSIRARNLVELTTGNAGGVEISFNGEPVAPLGGDGQKKQATFTPQGIQR